MLGNLGGSGGSGPGGNFGGSGNSGPGGNAGGPGTPGGLGSNDNTGEGQFGSSNSNSGNLTFDGNSSTLGSAIDAGAFDAATNFNVSSDLLGTSSNIENQLAPLLDQLRQSLDETGASDQTINLARQLVETSVAIGATSPVTSAQEYQDRVNLVLRLAGGGKTVSLDLSDRAQAADSGDLIYVDLTDSVSQQNVHAAGDPIEMFSGQFVFDHEDIFVSGAGIDFVFRRTYKNKVFYEGPIGVNWDHSYNLWIGKLGETLLLCSNGALREYIYTRHPKFGQTEFNYWIPPDGQHDVIVENGNSFDRITPDGVRYVHEPHASIPQYHRLRRIQDRFGNYLAFSYTQDVLSSVEVNHASRVVQFAYDVQDRIIAVTDHNGRSWTYDYDDLGDLVAVTQPVTDRYRQGLTTRYEYSTSRYAAPLAHNLLRVVDPGGRVYLENEYGVGPINLGFNRVIRQRLGNGETQLDYEILTEELSGDYTDLERPVVQVNLIGRGGQPLHFVYNKFGNLLLREELLRTERGIELAQWRYRYNADGALIGALTPEGRMQQGYYGRDDFLRVNGIGDESVATHDALTIQARLAFGSVLAVVQRGRTYALAALDMSHGVWGNIFPDAIAAQPEDAVQKWTYESDYQQILTSSHPRFTRSADPRALETADYQRTLTKFSYTGPSGDANRQLFAISHPAVTQSGGSILPGSSETFDSYDGRGRILQRTDTTGVVTRYTYFDATDGVREGFLQSVIRDPATLALTTSYERDDLGRVSAVHSPRSQGAPLGQFVTRFELNALDQVITITSSPPFNHVVRRLYDANGLIERVERDAKDETGADVPDAPEIRTFSYDEELNLVRESAGGFDLSKHFVTRHAYDAAGRRVATVLPAGNRLFFHYDERGLPSGMTRGPGTPDASTTERRYDLDGLLIGNVSARGFLTRISRDPFGRIVAREDALGHVSRFDYDKSGNLTVLRIFERQADATHALLARGEMQYDELNRPMRRSINLFDAPVAATDLDTDGLASPGPGRLLTTQLYYEPRSRLARIVDPLGRITTLEYGVFEQPLAVVDAAGNRFENRYDANQNLIRRDVREVVRDPTTRASLGELVFTRTYAFDALDRLQRTTDALGNTMTYAYDGRSNVATRTDPLANVVRTEYDVYGRAVRYTRSLTNTGLGTGSTIAAVVTQLSYDANGNLTDVIDPMNRLSQQRFDDLDRLRAITYPDKTEVTLEYDRDSFLSTSKDANGVRRVFTRDGLGRVGRVDLDANAAIEAVEGAAFDRYEYDALGLLRVAENAFAHCETKRNSVGWPIADTTTFTLTDAPLARTLLTQRTFDDAGAPAVVTYPDGRQVKFTRNLLGQITRIENVAIGLGYPGLGAGGASMVAQFDYSGRRRARGALGNAAASLRAYDRAARLVEVQHLGAGSAPLVTVQQLFDDAGNIRLRDFLTPTANTGDAFAYDSLSRLTFATPRMNPPAITMSAFAPATSTPPDPGPSVQTSIDAVIGALAQPLTSPTWQLDLVGNRSAGYAPNALDEYGSVAGVVRHHDASGNLRSDGARSYHYDSVNRLVRVADASGTDLVRYHHDALGRRVAELAGGVAGHFAYDGLNCITEYRKGQPLAQVVYDGLDAPVHLATGNGDYWYHLDPTGSVIALTDQAGQPAGAYRYAPFGNSLQASGPHNRLRFAGRPLDEAIGSYDFRARQYDPTIGRFLQRDPRGMRDGTNLYTYAGNDPVAYTDPLGTSRQDASATSPSPVAGLSPTQPTSSRDFPVDPVKAFKALDALQKSVRFFSIGNATRLMDLANAVGESDAPDFVARGVWGLQDLVSSGAKQVYNLASGLGANDGPDGIFRVADGFKVFGAAVSGVLAALEADKRGVGTLGALGDLGVSYALSLWGSKLLQPGVFGVSGSYINPIDALINVVHGVVSVFSPNAAVYTKIIASVTPSQTVKQFAISAIDSTDALARWDYNRAVQTHEQRLSGAYGAPVQGYALFFDAYFATATGQESEMFKLTNAAANGELGPLAEFGDWLGDQPWVDDVVGNGPLLRTLYGR